MSSEPDWTVPRRIDSMGQLTNVIETVQHWIREGALRQVPRESSVLASAGDFLDLPADGPWGDVLAYDFEHTKNGKRFTLDCETFHGQGGAWQPAD